ncbi:multicopper oxidase family protein [Hansschlegelia zhihuaiae]|uniref:Multicopper oxidase family protein n=1 Tax=Hansschlegelia zhihuaiae TaxID=405005 RepID=A0A4Q0M805_9HYPH|nr:multicopper oxidase family protein [Hansschlegelia zhihuaiae]RXF69260.1 multicopper oxidase family protein [Hansschlegelia zhihuaiae]
MSGFPELSRRAALGGGLAVAGVALLSARGLARPAKPVPLPPRTAAPATGEHRLSLVAAERSAKLLGPDGPTTPVWTYADDLFHLVRMRLGETLHAELDNRLSEHTAIHWHGLRIPNDQDGVPYVTQPPVKPGERHAYDFTPPDAGTFWFHPHCDTVAQLGRGLAGVLIVEGDETQPYDADVALVLKDWRIDEATGQFIEFSTTRGALRAGTFGTVRTVNGGPAPRLELPAGGDARIRLLNLDSTRVGDIGIEGAEAAVVAIDGNPVSPFPLKEWRLGPAMRLDLVVRVPAEGGEARLFDYFAAKPVLLATIAGEGEDRKPAAFDPAPLSRSDVPEPKLKGAGRLSFAFATASEKKAALAVEADPLSAALLDSLCAAQKTNWTINREAWPAGGDSRLPKPLALLKLGRSYVAELSNETPHVHPIHLHGFTFKVLRSTRRDLPVHFADTVLLTPKERITIAFVADRPGDWMIHCHLIEHQETGMMGYLKVA